MMPGGGKTETRRPRLIGLTGGIGAGKSLATGYLREKGYPVIDADELAREATRAGAPALAEIRRLFGDEVFVATGGRDGGILAKTDGVPSETGGILSGTDDELDRAALARIVFADAEKRAALEELLHAEVLRRMEQGITAAMEADLQTPAVFLSIPLLYETGAERFCDEVWLVTADDALRLSRAMARDGASEEQVRARMAAQLPEEERRARADVLLENSGPPESLYAQIDARLALL